MSNVVIVEGLSPEDVAMLQALYSRSAASVTTHLEKVKASGSGKFMESYYVGYSHKSIGDCGTATIFIEGVSTLAAKAIQDWPLYSGQETSTRYIDMSKQGIVDPVGTSESKAILDAWMSFYTRNQDRVNKTIQARYPQQEGEKSDVYDRAVKARTFDVLRGFIPAGIKTQLSWHTNLRQALDHLPTLVNHQSEEISGTGKTILATLAEAYRSSGFDREPSEQMRAWNKLISTTPYAYPSSPVQGFRSDLSSKGLAEYQPLFQARPKGATLPHFLTDLGQLHFGFTLDFGSFRDLQRHRNGVCRMPLLTTALGFEPWYLNQLDGELAAEAHELIEAQTERIEQLDADLVSKQYYTALGYRVPCQVTYALPGALYVMELRSSKTVHPTLRSRIHEMIVQFQEHYPSIPLHVDMSQDDWDVRRGTQTIIEK